MKQNYFDNPGLYKKATPKPKSSIAIKLKKVLHDLTIKIGKQEKQVTRNILAYLEQIAKQDNIPMPHMMVRINKQEDTVRVFVHQKNRLLKEIPVKELVLLFAGNSIIGQLPGIERSVAYRMARYIDELIDTHSVPPYNLNILLTPADNIISIQAFDKDSIIRNIPLKELLTYFGS